MIELLFDFILEASILVDENTKIKPWIKFPLIVLGTLLDVFVVVWIGWRAFIKLEERNIGISIILFLLAACFLIFTIINIKKKWKQKRQIHS